MARLPLDARGYPVPWFVAWIDGAPDFRVIGPGKLAKAVNYKLCWLCGEPLGRFGAFVIGPMCALNRTSSEPPSHRDCAIFAATACPFLTRPNAERRSANLPADYVEPAGVGLKRNPGACLVWVTRSWKWFRVENGALCEVGDPTETLWYAEGRAATREEIDTSILTGLPLLLAECPTDPKELADGLTEIAQRLEQTGKLMPGEASAPRDATEIVGAAWHAAAFAEVTRLVELDPAAGTPECERLKGLAAEVERYEREHFPIGGGSAP